MSFREPKTKKKGQKEFPLLFSPSHILPPKDLYNTKKTLYPLFQKESSATQQKKEHPSSTSHLLANLLQPHDILFFNRDRPATLNNSPPTHKLELTVTISFHPMMIPLSQALLHSPSSNRQSCLFLSLSLFLGLNITSGGEFPQAN